MKKVDRFWYQVNFQESISIQVTPSINLGDLYTANLDGTTLEKPPNGRYAFLAIRPITKKHFFLIEFSFAGAQEGAEYILEINGDTAGNSGPFKVRVKRNDSMLLKTFVFEMVQEPV